MKFSLRKALVFTAQFLPLFLLTLWVYSRALPVYQPAVLGVANSITRSLPSPSAIETLPEGGWWGYTLSPTGDKKSINHWPAYMTHLLFLSLALLPALILATPAPIPDRLRMLAIGLVLLFLVHVASVIGLVRQTQCLVVKPGSFHCLWILRLVYASGQIFGALLWGLLTWRYWFPGRAPRASGGGGPAAGAAAAGLLLLLLTATGCHEAPLDRPNLIVLVVDTLRADHLGVYGFPGDVSPTIDRLAAESLVFDRAFAQAPWTKPSTASLFTSLYPQVHRVTTHSGEGWGALPGVNPGGSVMLAPQAITLAEVLRDGGYETGAFGANPFISKTFGFDQGFDTYDVVVDFERNRADQLVAAARSWLERREAAKPFFLYLHFMDVHAPYAADQEDYQALKDSVASSARVLTRQELPTTMFKNIEIRPEWDRPDLRRRVDYWRARYAAGVRSFDRKLAALFSYLEDSGLQGSTYVVLTSDHGEELFEHDSWSHGYTLYDHQLRIPLIVRSPDGTAGGRRTDQHVEAVDVMPTLLALARIDAPDGVQGSDLSSLLSGGAIDRPQAVFAGASLGPGRTYALRTPDHKLILDVEAGGRRLFELAMDPQELNDVAGAQPDLAERLSARLRRHLEDTVADGVLDAEAVEVPQELLDSIEALGYVGR